VSEQPIERIPTDPRTKLSRRTFLRRAAGGLTATAAGTFLYTWRVEPHWLEIVRRGLPIQGLPSELAGKRMVQVSDLHAGPIVDQDFLIRSMEGLAELEPDLIVLTGDFMTSYGDEEVPKALEAMRALPPAPLGRIAVLGNHDYGEGWRHYQVANKLAARLEQLDVLVLRNEVTEVSGLQFAGIDEVWTSNFNPVRAFSRLATDRPAIALCHNPDSVDRPQWQGFQGWTLCGHTHGGQCKPPFFGPPYLPVLNKRWVAGEYDLAGGGKMYINRGLGYLQRVRFNARPEITVFTLEQA